MQYRMMLLNSRRAVVATMALLLVGCATPNVKPFAEQTTRLATSVSLEQRALATEFTNISKRLEKLESKEQRARRDERADELEKKREDLNQRKNRVATYDRIVKAALQKAVTYSDQLASLAEAGESGSDAAGSLINTVNSFASLGGMGAGIVVGSVAQALKVLGELHVRKEAQDSLEKATKAAQPAVDALADVVAAIYEENGPYHKLVTGLELKSTGYLREDAGIHTIGLYNRIDGMRDQLFFKVQKHMARFDVDKGFCVDAAGRQQDSCFAARDIQTVADLNRMMQQVEPIAQKYEADKNEIEQRFAKRLSNARIIVRAVKQWRLEHQKIAGVLEKCGGLKFQKCQAMNVSNLKTVVEELRERLKAEE